MIAAIESSGITLRNNEIKKYYESNLVSRKLRNLIKKNYWKCYKSKRRIPCFISKSLDTINEKSTHTTS